MKVDYSKASGEVVFDDGETSINEILNSRAFKLNYRAEVIENE